jgi:hypothetical protein
VSCAGKGEVISSSEAPLDSIPPPTHVRNYGLDGMWPLTPSGSVNYVYIVITGKCLTEQDSFGNVLRGFLVYRY